MLVDAAGRYYKEDTAAGKEFPSFAAECSNLEPHSNRRVQMTRLQDSFSQSDKEALFPWPHMLLWSDDPLGVLNDF